MSETPTVDESGGNGLNRRDLLVKAGVVGAGAVAAGSLAGAAAAAPKRIGATPKKGGKLTFALEQDPVHIAPFGAILTSNHWGKEPMYESLIEWDAKLNQRPALAQSWKVVDPKTVDFTLKRGIRFHNGKEVTAAVLAQAEDEKRRLEKEFLHKSGGRERIATIREEMQ